jgi:hypothetical protein
MLDRSLPDLREPDFDSLVTNGVAESRSLEFKRDLPSGNDADTREFLADVTSLANAQGGDLIYGIEDRDGVATRVIGIDEIDIDATVLRLESIIRDGIEPRLAVRTQGTPLASGRVVLVIRIPASLAAPHRIRFKNNGRFWNRNSRGKYEMDVHELRHAFTQSEAMPQQLRRFHEEAVAAAEGLNMPFVMDADPTAVISILPLGMLRERRDIELTPEHTILPVKSQNGTWLPTLEGMLWHTPLKDGHSVRSYALTHRSGHIDAAWTIGGTRKFSDGSDGLVVWAKNFEEGVAEMAIHGVSRLQSYSIGGPWVVMATVLGIKGALMANLNGDLSRPAWRDRARLPELILEHVSNENLAPIFKSFWLLFGMIKLS